jgi:hypothetical protein
MDLNPVRAGIVKDPADYRWSSYGEAVEAGPRATAGGRGRGWCAHGWLTRAGRPTPNAFRDWRMIKPCTHILKGLQMDMRTLCDPLRGRIPLTAMFPGCSSRSLLDPGLQSSIPAGIKMRSEDNPIPKGIGPRPVTGTAGKTCMRPIVRCCWRRLKSRRSGSKLCGILFRLTKQSGLAFHLSRFKLSRCPGKSANSFPISRKRDL